MNEDRREELKTANLADLTEARKLLTESKEEPKEKSREPIEITLADINKMLEKAENIEEVLRILDIVNLILLKLQTRLRVTEASLGDYSHIANRELVIAECQDYLKRRGKHVPRVEIILAKEYEHRKGV